MLGIEEEYLSLDVTQAPDTCTPDFGDSEGGTPYSMHYCTLRVPRDALLWVKKQSLYSTYHAG